MCKTLNPKSGLGKRAAACIAMYQDTKDWEGVVASDSLMLYSADFRKYVAEKCGVNPESGKPISGFTQDELKELAASDAEIDKEEEEAEVEAQEEEVEEEAEEVEDDVEVVASHDACHWCGSTDATVCLMVQVQKDDETRLIRMDHLCEDCAAAYWTAIHNVQKERMF